MGSRSYTYIYESVARLESIVLSLTRLTPEIIDPNERGAVATLARSTARRLNFLADLLELVGPTDFATPNQPTTQEKSK